MIIKIYINAYLLPIRTFYLIMLRANEDKKKHAPLLACSSEYAYNKLLYRFEA